MTVDSETLQICNKKVWTATFFCCKYESDNLWPEIITIKTLKESSYKYVQIETHSVRLRSAFANNCL